MADNDKKLWIQNMNADRFSGKAGGSLEKDFHENVCKPMREKVTGDTASGLYFALMAKKFLETPVKKSYLNNRSDLFIDELSSIFLANIDTSIELSPKYTNIIDTIDGEVVSQEAVSTDFSAEIPIEDLYNINAEIRGLYKKHDIFASFWDYYILDNGIEKDDFVTTKIEDWEESDNNPETLMCSPELGLYNRLPDDEKIDVDGVIINSGDQHKKIIFQLSDHLGLDANTSTGYVAELLKQFPPTNKKSIALLTEELQKELKAEERNDWNVMLIASIIASYTHDPVLFSRMSMYKLASARSITDDIINEDHLNADIVQAETRYKDWFKYINKGHFNQYILALGLATLATALDSENITINTKCKNADLKLYKGLLEGNMKLIATDAAPHYESIQIMMNLEYDAIMDAMQYFTEPDDADSNDSITDVKKHKRNVSRMMKNKKIRDEERQEIIIEEALMQDSTFVYLQDPFLFSQKRFALYNDKQLVEVIEDGYAGYGTFEQFIALMLYVGNGTTINEMYNRMMNYDYIVDGFYNTLSYINSSLEMRYVDFGFEYRIMSLVSDYITKIMEHRITPIKQAIVESTLYDYEFNVIEQEILSYIAAIDQKLDAGDMKQQFVQLVNSVVYEYDTQLSKDDDTDDLDEQYE